MADVFFELSDLEICKDEVKESTDITELTAWLNEQNEVSQELAIMLGAMKFAPNADTERMARKLGFVNISKCWIQRRLKELGVDDERATRYRSKADNASDKVAAMKAHQDAMAKALQERNAKIKALNIENSDLRSKLFAYERRAAA